MSDSMTLSDERFGNLSISRDVDDNDEANPVPIAVFLYVPDMEEHDHDHIVMDLETCRILRDWLSRFLADNGAP